MPTSTASGNKLPLGWINRDSNENSIDRSKLPKGIISYNSASGWINHELMYDYLNDIIKPYTKSKPAALIMDEYKAHWEDRVQDLARSMNLELIKVPPGTTSTQQPLDISVNGPMKQIRQRIYVENKIIHPNASDSIELAVNRSFSAYQQITPQTIIKGWKQICPLLDQL